ncbi:MAG: DUF302 domain-containing protein [Candidatus Sedimenticola sp. 6PFRAG7]
MRYLLILILSFSTLSAWAAEAISPTDAPIVIFKTDYSFDDTRENLELAITGRGMLISGTLHISDMLQRTAKDTGHAKLYEKAESLEFCSVLLSHKMSSAHPANLSICPLTIGIYVKAGEPENTYVTYRRPVMLGEAGEATAALTDLFESVIDEALE